MAPLQPTKGAHGRSGFEIGTTDRKLSIKGSCRYLNPPRKTQNARRLPANNEALLSSAKRQKKYSLKPLEAIVWKSISVYA